MTNIDEYIQAWGQAYLQQVKAIKPMSTGTTAPREGDTIRVTQTKVMEGKYAEDGCIITGTYGDHDSIPKDAKVEVVKRRGLKVQDLISGGDVYYESLAGQLRPGTVIRNQNTGKTLVREDAGGYWRNQTGNPAHVSNFIGVGSKYKVIYLGEG